MTRDGTAKARAGPGGLDIGGLRRELADAPDGGRLNPLALGRVVSGPGALDALAALVAGLRRPAGDVVVLAAATPMSVDGRDLRAVIQAALADRFAVGWVVVGPAGGDVHADEPTVAAAAAAAAGAGCVITVGSGTITDIGKAAASDGAPLVAVQTATSVNGYADPFSVLLRHGVKRTAPSRWPDALVIDPAVLQDAPPELNRAGAGDLMAMFTATADWYLASVIGLAPGPDLRPADPPYHPAVAALAQARGPRLLALAPRLGGGAAAADPAHERVEGRGAAWTEERATQERATREGGASRAPRGEREARREPGRPDPASLAELADMLTVSGVAMGVAGSTAPASGMEHAISHLLEMAATGHGPPASFHGAQVGVASIVAARTWAHVLTIIADGGLDRRPALPDPDTVRGRISRAFAGLDPGGSMAAECFDDYARKLGRLRAADGPGGLLGGLRSSWPAHHAALDTMLADPATLAGALLSAGLPARFRDLAEPVDDATAYWAVANCPLLRRRFCVADLAMLLGAWEDADVENVLAGVSASRVPAVSEPEAVKGEGEAGGARRRAGNGVGQR
ncbi:MAG TPA: iron-containing alcohol dehydrogenase [Streptosporangiaceae bacterium]|nr:iron-containing alcohol dehydrogenase [Streptosporangiaceae bacterium]